LHCQQQLDYRSLQAAQRKAVQELELRYGGYVTRAQQSMVAMWQQPLVNICNAMQCSTTCHAVDGVRAGVCAVAVRRCIHAVGHSIGALLLLGARARGISLP
jgi:hypothetical protein